MYGPQHIFRTNPGTLGRYTRPRMSHLIAQQPPAAASEGSHQTSQALVSAQHYSFAVLKFLLYWGGVELLLPELLTSELLHLYSTHGRSKVEGTLLLSLHQFSSDERFITSSALLKVSVCLTVVLGMLHVQKKTVLLSNVSR